ncbi:MAG: hypothetical protein GXO92_08895 [FCB group bacterium]|nr:hypothetical protein [FCB group bacterium]
MLIRLSLLFVFLWTLGCEDENISTNTYVEIDASVQRIELGGYDGYIVTDWEITNTSDKVISGWEIRVRVVTASYQSEEGIFFNHDVRLQPGETELYTDNILFHLDADNMYPIMLKNDDTSIRLWDIVEIKGIVR